MGTFPACSLLVQNKVNVSAFSLITPLNGIVLVDPLLELRISQIDIDILLSPFDTYISTELLGSTLVFTGTME